MRLLSVRQLSHSYGQVPVLKRIHFDVNRGELIALLGPSGSGKTTLLRSMAGLIKTNSGEVLVDGRKVSLQWGSHRSEIAVIFQQFNLIGRVSALDNVLAGRLGQTSIWRGLFKVFSRADRLLALECLERVGLLDFAQQRADTLSGGQQQRVAIARALAQRAKIILADEPIASLDSQASHDVMRILKSITIDKEVTVICSLHQLEFARTYASRIVRMEQGEIKLDDPPSQE